jgi:5-methylcytosine-specific restriction enzyme subunit McrC
MTRRVVQLREWESDHREVGLSLTDADRALARALGDGAGRLGVTELADSLRLDATAWVGVVRFSELEIQIVPKLVGENLGILQMLEYSSGLGALARLDAARTLATERDGSLVDLLALLLAEGSIRIAKQGILHDYVTREESLARVRGRLLVFEQVTRRYGQLQTLECRFDELETDIPENQLLAAGLAIAKRAANDPDVRRLVARAHAIYSEAADSAASLIDPPVFDYTRRNEHYRPAHLIARMFIRNLAVNDLYAPGSGESFAFLLDMNRLFEDFITRVLQDVFRDTDVRVRPQVRDSSLIRDARTGKPYAAVIPDILLESGVNPVRQVPVDAKYKLYDQRKIDQGDIYQTFFYAWAYADEDSVTDAPAFILYPGAIDSMGAHLRAQARSAGRGASIRAVPVDVPALLGAIRARARIQIPELGDAMWPAAS